MQAPPGELRRPHSRGLPPQRATRLAERTIAGAPEHHRPLPDHPRYFRDRLKEWDAKGWRIDMDEVTADKNKVAYAIPSPARRRQKGWVVDAVPMIGAKQAAAKLKAAS